MLEQPSTARRDFEALHRLEVLVLSRCGQANIWSKTLVPMTCTALENGTFVGELGVKVVSICS